MFKNLFKDYVYPIAAFSGGMIGVGFLSLPYIAMRSGIWLMLGYFLNLLPFAAISRVTFLYHYLASLTFGILILAFITQKLFSNNLLYFSFLNLVILAFLFFSPITYGLPVTSGLNHFYQNFVSLLH